MIGILEQNDIQNTQKKLNDIFKKFGNNIICNKPKLIGILKDFLGDNSRDEYILCQIVSEYNNIDSKQDFDRTVERISYKFAINKNLIKDYLNILLIAMNKEHLVSNRQYINASKNTRLNKESRVSDFTFDKDEEIITEYVGDAEICKIPQRIEGANVAKVGTDAFRNCNSMRSVYFSCYLKFVYNRAFLNCRNLKEVKTGSVYAIYNDAFKGCSSLKNISLANELNEIGQGCFQDCISLESVNIPTEVFIIQENTFAGCTKLESITLPDKLQAIEKQAFKDCKSLKEITLPKNIYEIGPKAFENCTSLKTVKLCSLDTVKWVDSSIFENCTSLEKIVVTTTKEKFDAKFTDGNMPSLRSIVFKGK